MALTVGSEQTIATIASFNGRGSFVRALSASHVLFGYADENGSGSGIVLPGDVSGTTITPGTGVSLVTDTGWFGDCARLDDTHGLVVWESDATLTQQADVITVSGSTASDGGANDLTTTDAPRQVQPGDASTVAQFFRNGPDTAANLRMQTLAASGATVSGGTISNWDSGTCSGVPVSSAVDADHYLLADSRQSGGAPTDVGVVIVARSGTTLTAGTRASVSTAEQVKGVAALSPTKGVLVTRPNSGGAPKFYPLTISGTTVTIGTPVTFAEASFMNSRDDYTVSVAWGGRLFFGFAVGGLGSTIRCLVVNDDLSLYDYHDFTGGDGQSACALSSSALVFSYMNWDTGNLTAYVLTVPVAPSGRPRMRGRHVPNAVRIRGREHGAAPTVPRMRGRQAS